MIALKAFAYGKSRLSVGDEFEPRSARDANFLRKARLAADGVAPVKAETVPLETENAVEIEPVVSVEPVQDEIQEKPAKTGFYKTRRLKAKG